MFSELGQAAADLGVGVALLVDELQELTSRELAAVAGGSHHAAQNSEPVVVIGAGLPNLPAALSEARSYAERLYTYRRIGSLSPSDAAAALVRPADALGARWAADAVDHVVAVSGGYPYFVQLHGRMTWDVASGETITIGDAEVGAELARAELDDGFFGSRWERATPAERAYLRAVAEVGGDGPAPTAGVAANMERSLQSVSVLRAGVIGKGLLYTPDRGAVAFTVPGMATFIARHPD